MGLDIFPTMTQLNSTYGLPVNTIFKCDFFFGSRIGTNLHNIRFRKFCIGICSTLSLCVSIFSNSVIYVILVCSKKQMLRVNTSSIIACMKNMDVFWNLDRKSVV